MARQINDEGLKLIKQWEGCILYAYDDFDPPKSRRRIQAGDRVRGTLTIGYGHTGSDVKPGMMINNARADALLRQDLAAFERGVAEAVKVELNDNQFAALVAFAFNVGLANFRSSSLLRKLNAGDIAAVPKELAKWTSSKGQQMQGLVNRRAAESGLWAKGSFVSSNSIPTEPTKPTAGKTTQKVGVATTLGGAVTQATTALMNIELGFVKYVVAGLILVGLGLTVWGIFHGEREEAA